VCRSGGGLTALEGAGWLLQPLRPEDAPGWTEQKLNDHILTFPVCAGPSFERLSFDSSAPGSLNLIFRFRGRSPDLGNAFLGLFRPIRID